MLGYTSTLVTVYYLAIKNIPQLLDVFPKFVPFAILATAIGTPLSVVVGWVHLKRSQLAASEQHISVEMSPYTYMLPKSGIAMDVQTPSALLQLQVIRKIAEREGILTPKEEQLFKQYEDRYTVLLNGGYVGVPYLVLKQK